MMKSFDESFKINHNSNWLYIPGHPYRVLIIGGSESSKTNVLVNLIKHQRLDMDKNLFKCQRSIWIKVSISYQRMGKVKIEKLENPKAFIEYSQTIDDV